MSERFVRLSVVALLGVVLLAVALLLVPRLGKSGQPEATFDEGAPLDVRNRYPAQCPVHATPLADDTVPVSYGLPDFAPVFAGDSYGRQMDLFPYAEVKYANGCVISDDSPWRAQVRYCSDCRDARSAYFADGQRQ